MSSVFKPLVMTLALSAGVVGGAASASAELPPLRENQFIYNTLFAAAIGDEIRKNCDSISPRMFRVLGKARELERHAKELGYSDEAIDAFLNSKEEQEIMKGLRDKYLADHGVVVGEAETYCVLGRAEIEAGSSVGYLLREN